MRIIERHLYFTLLPLLSHTDHISDLQPHNIWRTKTNSIGFGGKSLKQFLQDQKLQIDILEILLLGGNF